jgi:hypothetical protein
MKPLGDRIPPELVYKYFGGKKMKEFDKWFYSEVGGPTDYHEWASMGWKAALEWVLKVESGQVKPEEYAYAEIMKTIEEELNDG